MHNWNYDTVVGNVQFKYIRHFGAEILLQQRKSSRLQLLEMWPNLQWCLEKQTSLLQTWKRTSLARVPPGHGKSWNLGRSFFRPGKSWKIAKVIESHGKVMENDKKSWNFYYYTEQFCKSDTTSFIKSNYEL